MKTSLFVAFILISLSTKIYAQSVCTSKNHIILIHGIGGSAKSFGQMESYLRKLDPCYQVRSFEFDTGNSQLSTVDFAQSFHQDILNHIQSGDISPQDKLSLIMHSEGGIVGNLWLNSIRELHPFLYQQIDAFITLSTPHWGSEFADIGSRVYFSKLPFGKIELNEMSYGSATIQLFSSMLAQSFRPLNFRPLAMGGIHKIKNKVIGENDIIVPVYSSRPDHFFATADIDIDDDKGLIPASVFTKTARMPFVTVPATHVKIDLPGIALIPDNCLDEKGCDHPSLPVITDHLKGRSIASTTESLDHFRSSLYLTNLTGEKIQEKDVKIEIVSSKNITIPLSQKLAQYRGKADLANGLAFSFHGHTQKSGIQQIRIRLIVKNKFERLIDVPVEGGFASVAQLNLKN